MMDLETLKRENEKVAAGGVPYWHEESERLADARSARLAASQVLKTPTLPHEHKYTVVWKLRSTIDYTLTYYSTQVIPAHYGFSSLPATPQMWLDLAETAQFGLEGAPVGNVPMLSMVLLGAAQRIETGT